MEVEHILQKEIINLSFKTKGEQRIVRNPGGSGGNKLWEGGLSIQLNYLHRIDINVQKAGIR